MKKIIEYCIFITASLILFFVDSILNEIKSEILYPVYLNQGIYTDLEIINEDFTSEEFFKSFEIKMQSGVNNYKDYVKFCSDATYFGYFQKGNLTKFFLYDDYGTLSISFNLFIMEDLYMESEIDRINFYFNGILASSKTIKEMISDSKNTFNTTICGVKVWSYFISLNYVNNNNKGYFPLSLVIETEFSLFTNNYWGIKDFHIEKMRCPSKCTICNSTSCLGCSGDLEVFADTKCICKSTQDSSIFDFSSSDDKIDCRSKKIKFN